jgi:hypothetical protein
MAPDKMRCSGSKVPQRSEEYGQILPVIETRPLFVLQALLDPPHINAPTPMGVRKAVPVIGGTFVGDRLRGTIAPYGGHDWALTRNDGALVLDVRLTLITDDGEAILMSYYGIRTGSPDALARLARGEAVDPSELYFRTAPRFETASEKYGWLNSIICVGMGERPPEGPRYHIYEVL